MEKKVQLKTKLLKKLAVCFILNGALRGWN